MAGRFLPQRDVDLITRVSRELVGDKQGNKLDTAVPQIQNVS